MAEVIPLHGGPMDEADYDRQRANILATYGKSGGDAKAHFEQALAKLFYELNWSQTELAKKEGRTQPWVAYHLCFGRFLASRQNITNGYNLTERRFRDTWALTDKAIGERERFREVERLLAGADGRRMDNHSSKIGKAIRANFMDGKWHGPSTIAKALDEPEAEVEKTLELAYRRGAGNATYRVEKIKRPRGAVEYRLFPTEKKISSFELTEKLTPIIEYLRTEGKKMMAMSTISAARECASRLENLLKEWT